MRSQNRSLFGARFVLCALLALPLSGVMAQELGRLFTTDAERRSLDRLRLEAQFARPAPAPTPAPQQAQAVDEGQGPSVSRLEINGIVRRSQGPATVWVNGGQVERGRVSREGLTVQAGPRSGSGVRVSLPSGLSTVRLKPGQAVDVSTGTLVDAFERQPDAGAASGIQSAPDLPAAEAVPTGDPAAAAAEASALVPPPAEAQPARTATQRMSHQRLREISALPPAQRAAALKAAGSDEQAPQ